MALDKQKFAMSVAGGLDTKTDDKNVLATNWLELENVNFTKLGSFTKRFGYDLGTIAVSDGTSILDGSAITTFKDEFLLYSATKLYSYSATRAAWVNKGDVNPGINREFAAYSDGSPIDTVTMTTGGNYDIYMFRKFSKNVLIPDHAIWYKIIDNTTNTVVIEAQIASTSSNVAPRDCLNFCLRVVYTGTKFVLFYTKEDATTSGADTIVYRVVDITTPETISAETTVTGNSGFFFDVEFIGTKIFLLGSFGGIVRYSSAGVFETSITAYTVAGTGANYPVALCRENATDVRIVYSLNGTAVQSKLYSNALSVISGPTAVFSDSSMRNISCIMDPQDSTRSYIFVSLSLSTVKMYTVTSAGSASGATKFSDTAKIFTKPMIINGLVHIVMSKAYPFFSTAARLQVKAYYVMRFDSTTKLISYFHLLDGIQEFATNDPGNATAVAATTTPIVYAGVSSGTGYNGHTIVTRILPKAANPTNKVLVDFTGSASAIVITVTPNDGTNGNNNVANTAATATIPVTSPIVLTSVAKGTNRNTATFTIEVLAAAANPTNTVLVDFSGNSSGIIVTVTPNDGTHSGGTPVTVTTADLVQLINTGLITGKNPTITDAGSLRALQTATGGGGAALTNGGEGDGVGGTFSGGVNVPTFLTTADLVELINTGSVTGKATTITDGSSLRALQTATGGDTTIMVEAGEGDNVLAVFREQDMAPSKFLSQVVSNSDNIYFPGTIITDPVVGGTSLDISGNYLRIPTALKKMEIDFSQTSNYFDTEMNNNSHVSGGVLRMYDSRSVVEHNFVEIPLVNNFIVAGNIGTATNFQIGDTYKYITVFAWTDEYGQLHRSATSIPVSYTAVVASDFISVLSTSPTFTSKNLGDIQVEFYRTLKNGSIYYRAGSTLATTSFNSTNGEVGYSDNTPDALLIGNEVLYTTGSILDNFPCPPSKFITSYKGRLITLSSDGDAINYSKLQRQNEPMNFAAEFSIPIDANGGPATCLAIMDDHVLIFKENVIYALTGEGPNDAGQQDDFRLPYLITTDVGCVNQNSIVRTPDGIMFESNKGIYLMHRGFAVTYIGAPVEAYNNLDITSATLLENVNQVRFTTTNGRALIYDYFVKMWTTHVGLNSAVDAVIYNDTYYYLASDGHTHSEGTTFNDAGSIYIPIKIVSAWIQTGGIQGFQRFYQLMVLGTYLSAHNFICSFGYDFSSTYDNSVTIDAGIAGPGLYQWRIFPKRQKCEAFRFMIQDSIDELGGSGQGLALSNFAALIGIKRGLNKRPAANSAGTN